MRLSQRTSSRARLASLIALVVALLVPAAPVVGGSISSAETTSDCDVPSWVVSWMMPQAGLGGPFGDQTLRIVAPLSLGGEALRIRLSNQLGHDPVTLEDVHVGVARDVAGAGRALPVTVAGGTSVTIPPGQYVVSDPVPLPVADGDSVAVSVYLPGPDVRGPGHLSTQAQMFVADGNRASQEAGDRFERLGPGARFITAIDVLTPNDGAVVAFGDSITEGVAVGEAALGELQTWPAVLDRRLRRDGTAPRISVVNAGIGGNRLLNAGTGPSGIDRFERDGLDQTGVDGILLLEGINDLLNPANGTLPPLEKIAAGYRDLIGRARASQTRLWVSPLTPAGDTTRPNPFGLTTTAEQVERRREINNWIRHWSQAYDSRLDFDSVIRDLRFPNWIRTAYDSGDNLHPNDAGHGAMGRSIDVSLFGDVSCTPVAIHGGASRPLVGPVRRD